MAEDQIEPLCQRLFEAASNNKEPETAALAIELFAGFLINMSQISHSLERIALVMEQKS